MRPRSHFLVVSSCDPSVLRAASCASQLFKFCRASGVCWGLRMPPRAVKVGDIFFLDGQTCIVFKREVIRLQDADGVTFHATVAYYHPFNGPYPTEENYKDVCDYSSTVEVSAWRRATPDHVREEVDEAAIYSEDDWEDEIASIEADSDNARDERPTDRQMQARARAERAAARASMEVSD